MNILLITADQLRADALGHLGGSLQTTPNLDRLAESGVSFKRAMTPNPICVPARASITTGNIPIHATGHKNNTGRILDQQPRLAEHFKQHGYRTYAFGKLHYVPYSPPHEARLLHGFEVCELCESGRIMGRFDPTQTQRGIEDYHDFLADQGWRGFSRAHGAGNNDVRPCASPLPEELFVDHWVADRTIAALKTHQEQFFNQPFLMWASFPKPHPPFDPPEPWHRRFDPREVAPPWGDESLLKERNPALQFDRLAHGHDRLSPEARRVIMAYYYGLVAFQDNQVGRLLDTLNKLGLMQNTLIVYTADHGELLGDFGCYMKKSMLEGSVRVPLIIHAPGVDASRGRTLDHLVGLEDILPTMADLADCPLDQPVDGLSLAPILHNPALHGRAFYCSSSLEPPWQTVMVRTPQHKYVYSEANATEELYDLDADPHELHNLRNEPHHEKTLEDLRGQLIEWARKVGDEALLHNGDLRSTPCDMNQLDSVPLKPMGWRWY